MIRHPASVAKNANGVSDQSPGSRSAAWVRIPSESMTNANGVPQAELWNPVGVREPQWLRTKFTSRRNGEAEKGEPVKS